MKLTIMPITPDVFEFEVYAGNALTGSARLVYPSKAWNWIRQKCGLKPNPPHLSLFGTISRWGMEKIGEQVQAKSVDINIAPGADISLSWYPPMVINILKQHKPSTLRLPSLFGEEGQPISDSN